MYPAPIVHYASTVDDDLRLAFDLRFARIIFTACASKRAVANVVKRGGVCGGRFANRRVVVATRMRNLNRPILERQAAASPCGYEANPQLSAALSFRQKRHRCRKCPRHIAFEPVSGKKHVERNKGSFSAMAAASSLHSIRHFLLNSIFNSLAVHPMLQYSDGHADQSGSRHVAQLKNQGDT